MSDNIWNPVTPVAAALVAIADAAQITHTPTLPMVATDVQAAIDELLALKAAIAGQVFTGAISAPNLSGTNTGDVAVASSADVRAGVNNVKTISALALLAALGISASYTSANQVITSAGQLVLAHGLTRVPRIITCQLVCTTAEAGYALNEIVEITSNIGHVIKVDAANLTLRFSSVATVYTIPHATTGVATALTNANWRLVVRAFG